MTSVDTLLFQFSSQIFLLYDHQFTLVLPEDITLTTYLILKSCCLFSMSSSAFFFLLFQKKMDLWKLWSQWKR